MRIGVDIGGTFTDFAVIDEETGLVHVEKLLTTESQPEAAIFSGLARLEAAIPGLISATSDIIHGTTLVTNTVIERCGGKTALLATRGFEDILEIGREVRYDVYDLFIRFPKPLVPRDLRFGITERALADGTIRTPLDVADVEAAVRSMLDVDVRAVAICFLHSYRNPANERAAAEVIRRLAPDIAISLSHEVSPEPKEYERTSTTVADAYVKTALGAYLERFESGLRKRGYRQSPYVMLSDGGTASVSTAQAFPIYIVESGPAAGVSAAIHFANLLGLTDALAFDMGGTTAKLCLLRGGTAARSRAFEVDRMHRFKAGSGMPVTVPVYDLVEIGAGGGSLARRDTLGLMKVGPESSSSNPGPACYAKGGFEVTVTDADLLLGHLDANNFLGGKMQLDVAAAQAAAGRLGTALGISGEEVAIGIRLLVDETMASAARAYVAEKGQSSSELTLIASGGAGPVHAASLARRLGCPRLVVPPYSGVMSSLGLLTAPVSFERSRSVRMLLDTISDETLGTILGELEHEAIAMLPRKDGAHFEHVADLQFAGQDHPLETLIVPVEGGWHREDWPALFRAQYRALYGRDDDENPIQLVSLRVRAIISTKAPRLIAPDEAQSTPTWRKAYDNGGQQYVSTQVVQRSALAAGDRIVGPAIIEERESTVVIGSGDVLMVHESGCLIIEINGSEEQRHEV